MGEDFLPAAMLAEIPRPLHGQDRRYWFLLRRPVLPELDCEERRTLRNVETVRGCFDAQVPPQVPADTRTSQKRAAHWRLLLPPGGLRAPLPVGSACPSRANRESGPNGN